MSRISAEIERRISGSFIIGLVIELILDNNKQPRARVLLDGVESAPLPWIAMRAGANRTWAVPSIGEQVLVACPNGDPANGIILGSLFCEEYPAPTDKETLTRYLFADGAVLDYDTETHALRAILPDGATAEITATGGMTLNGDVTIAGDLSVSGDVAADGDVSAGSISLKTHTHGAVQPGAGNTGVPQ
jgi:phage baseplate assembly protein V